MAPTPLTTAGGRRREVVRRGRPVGLRYTAPTAEDFENQVLKVGRRNAWYSTSLSKRFGLNSLEFLTSFSTETL